MSQFLVPDMTCGHCVKAITAAVTEADPAATLQIDLPSHVVSVNSPALSDDALAAKPRHSLARQEDPHSEAAERNREKARALKFLSSENGISLAQAAFRFILMHPGVSTVIGGFSDLPQLEECVPAACAGPLAPALMARVHGSNGEVSGGHR